jgi:hypothetical protein
MRPDEGRRKRRRTATRSDEALAGLFAELGPLLGRRERAEAAEPDPPFARPDPAFARALRARLTGEEQAAASPAGGRARGPRRRRPRAVIWLGVAAALLVVLALGAVAVTGIGLAVAVLLVLVLVVLLAGRRR